MVLVGEGEWDGLLEWLRCGPLVDHRIEPEDLSGLRVVSDPDEIVTIVDAAWHRQTGTARW